MKRLLLAAAAGAALVAATVAGGATGRDERLVVATLDRGGLSVSSGASLGADRRFRNGDRVALSEDGRLVAYTRPVEGRTEIRVADSAGRADRLVARLRPYDIALAFSPDGSRLAYSSAAGIATVPVAGGARRAVPLPRAWRGSRFSYLLFTPAGGRLVVSRTSGDGRAGTLRNELALLDLGSGKARTLFRTSNALDMQARPASIIVDDGVGDIALGVAFDGTGEIRTVSLHGGASQQLVRSPRGSADHSSLVSPDGRLIAFARTPAGGVADVYVGDDTGKSLRRLTTTPTPPAGTPKVGSTPLAWSPDSRRLLVFRHDRFVLVDVATRASTTVRKVGVRHAIPAARWLGRPPEPSRVGTIVFERSDDARGDLWTVRADGSGLRRLTANGSSYDPAWAPDGRRIAYTGGHSLFRALYTMSADGSAPERLVGLGPRDYVWAPSWYGSRILFTRHLAGGDHDLYSVDGDGGDATPVAASPAEEVNGSFTSDGRLAVEVERRTWIRGDGILRRLGEGSEPQWSPDGRRLVLVRNVSLHGGTIVVVRADGTGARAVGYGWSPSWSPDGTAIVYGSQGGLHTVRADGLGRPKRVTRTPRLVSDGSPSWRR